MRRISGLPSSLRWKPSPKLSTSLRLPVGLQGRERPRPPGPPSAAGGRVRHRACREWIGPFNRCICREGARRCLASLRVSLCIRSTASPLSSIPALSLGLLVVCLFTWEKACQRQRWSMVCGQVSRTALENPPSGGERGPDLPELGRPAPEGPPAAVEAIDGLHGHLFRKGF